ncbi:htpX protein [Halobacteriales archaeon QS_8_69_26]|nr:MAG: htpX protein [Halobacteriales archaeon QS_8_69_26]
MDARLGVRAWGVTLVLVAAAAGSVAVVFATGAPPLFVASGVAGLVYLSVVSWRSGGRFTVEAGGGRPYGPGDSPEIRDALLEVCDRTGKPLPRVVLVEMDAPGAMVGYDDGRPLLGVDPRLPRVIGPEGMRAIFAHELGHLGADIHTDAVREHLPTVVGFAAFWTVALAGRGPLVATAGNALFLATALVPHPRVVPLRYVLGLGTEPLALAASRYANRHEEYAADEFAARAVDPAAVTEALYRIAAVATGDNDEDVTGPVPWNADRSLRFALFATHPSIESRAANLDCELPEWVRPHRPHATA